MVDSGEQLVQLGNCDHANRFIAPDVTANGNDIHFERAQQFDEAAGNGAETQEQHCLAIEQLQRGTKRHPPGPIAALRIERDRQTASQTGDHCQQMLGARFGVNV